MSLHGASSPISSTLELLGGAPVVGRLVEIDADGRPVVDHPNWSAPRVARTCAEIPADVDLSVSLPVLLVFDGGSEDAPVIIGLVREHATPPARTVTVDGKPVVIAADRELVLSCGKSSIRLQRDGKVIIRGTEIVSRATRTNKVKGASVHIN